MATKAELVSAVAEMAGTSKKDAEAILQAFLDVVTKTLSKGSWIWNFFSNPKTSKRRC